MAKANRSSNVKKFTDIPNVGKAVVEKLMILKLNYPQDLKNKGTFSLYTKLNKRTGMRHDPCLLDTFIAAIDFMNGAPTNPWYYYIKERKKFLLLKWMKISLSSLGVSV